MEFELRIKKINSRGIIISHFIIDARLLGILYWNKDELEAFSRAMHSGCKWQGDLKYKEDRSVLEER